MSSLYHHLTVQIGILKEALQDIAYDPHCAYPEPQEPSASLADSQYKIGVADGHRCAAEKARYALAKAKAV